jgi:hypothetical protein
MLNQRQFAAAYDVQANKNSPTRRSGLFMKSENETYRRENYLSVVYLRKRMVERIKAESLRRPAVKRPCLVADTAHLALQHLSCECRHDD